MRRPAAPRSISSSGRCATCANRTQVASTVATLLAVRRSPSKGTLHVPAAGTLGDSHVDERVRDQRETLVVLQDATGGVQDVALGEVDDLHRAGRGLAGRHVADDLRSGVVLEADAV